ncbi:hypothetical protein LSH36_677g03010 [Paralvinella palmiformis]|uniref:Peroxisomal carnitine O-octanoyltransferase n=1 Tax=Paralvinella palmiformis TaxID=53620 RepID=A0AAD9MTS5_9ANNE|nr:hypothetical protein LSH36_677g03010 [Paralvinella palmiformis]
MVSLPNAVTTDFLTDGMSMPKGFMNDEEKTFQYQNQLPSLPIPNLSVTLAKYLDSVKPFLTDDQLHETQALLKRFESGEGRVLHEKFVEKCKNKRNWLEKWWEEYAYLRIREPHTPFVNFAGPGPYIEKYWAPKDGSQIERGAMVLWFALQYWLVIRQQRLQVERGGGKTVWCMEQIHRLFNGCKTPGFEVDKLHHHFKTEEEGSCPTYVVVTSNGRMYKLNIVHEDGSILTVPELEIKLRTIRDNSTRLGPGIGLGTLTTENRTTWAKLREHLLSLHPDNKCCLVTVEEAIMLVALDDRKPNNLQELAVESLCGDPSNRWFDKTLQLCIFDNGSVACNGDHAPHDAMVMIHLTMWTFTGIYTSGVAWQGRCDIQPSADPEELVFHVDPVIVEGISQARAQFDLNVLSLELCVDKYRKYGKSLLRSYNHHPDTFMQMALQLAYYRMYKRPAPTYETASTRKFYHGRTETVRSCTVEAVEWCTSMLDPTIKNKKKLDLFKRAMDKHVTMMKETVDSQGCDRHLFGLQITALEENLPTPEIFTHPSWTKR